MAMPLETLAMLGVSNLLIAATAGSVNADFYPGQFVLVTDRINFNGLNPHARVAAAAFPGRRRSRGRTERSRRNR